LTALATATTGQAGIGVPVAAVDEAIGRGRADMRTPTCSCWRRRRGLVEQVGTGVWALTEVGVQRLREDAELSDYG
jgi:hypothetical protein